MFTTLVSQPLYNGLISLFSIIPIADAGVIVVIFTVIIKLILLPLSIKASRSQLQMKSIQADLEKIKSTYPDKETQSLKTIEYYKEHNINPFSGIFLLFIQFPIIIGLYRIFIKFGTLQTTHEHLYPLYSFVHAIDPSAINPVFLHLINISQKSIILAVLAGITTYIQIALSSGSMGQKEKSMTGDIAAAMALQMKYVFPVLVIFISYNISGAVALYWVTSNVFSILQEMYIKKKYHQSALVIS